MLERAFSSDVKNTVTLPSLRQLNAISGDQSNKSQECKQIIYGFDREQIFMTQDTVERSQTNATSVSRYGVDRTLANLYGST